MGHFKFLRLADALSNSQTTIKICRRKFLITVNKNGQRRLVHAKIQQDCIVWFLIFFKKIPFGKRAISALPYISNINCQCKSNQFAYRDECFPNAVAPKFCIILRTPTLSSLVRSMFRQIGRSDLPRVTVNLRAVVHGTRDTYTILSQDPERRKPAAFAGHGTAMPPCQKPSLI